MKPNKKIGQYFVPNVKVLSTTEEKTTFRVVGVPFGGPDWLGGKDLHNERFTSKTDLGQNEKGEVIVKTVYAFYDHALNDSVGRDRMGYANYYQTTDQGQIWDIEVMRAYRYHDMLLQMAEKNLLGASSQPVQTSVDIDYESGDIKAWHVAEISLTPTPANPDAVVQIAKSFGFDLVKHDPDPEDGSDEDESEDDDAGDEIDGLFEDEEDEESGAIVSGEELEKRFTALQAAMTTLIESKFADLTKTVTTQAETQVQANKDLMKGLQAQKTALLKFAGHVAAKLKIRVPSLDDRSDDERDAENQRRSVSSPIPDGAPGKRKPTGANGNNG